MAYDPYRAAEQIVRNKGYWGTAVAKGESGDPYHNRALYYYDELRSNGYSGIADELEKSDYNRALRLLDGMRPQTEEYNASAALADSAADSESLRLRQNELADRLGEAYEDLFARVEKGTPEDSERYTATLDSYRKAGENAALGAIAESAAENSGNISSYAAANAHRQYQTYLNAGASAASSAASEKVDDLLSVLDSLYKNGNASIQAMQDRLENDRDTALSVYQTDADKEATLYKTDAERATALYKANLSAAEQERGGRLKLGAPEIEEGDDSYDREEKYLSYLLEAYPDYAEEIVNLFHYLG